MAFRRMEAVSSIFRDHLRVVARPPEGGLNSLYIRESF